MGTREDKQDIMKTIGKIPSWAIGLVITTIGVAIGYGILKYDVDMLKTSNAKKSEKIESLERFRTETLIILSNLQKKTSNSADVLIDLKERHVSSSAKMESNRKRISGNSKSISKMREKQAQMMKDIREEFVTKETFKQEKETIRQKFEDQKEQLKEKK